MKHLINCESRTYQDVGNDWIYPCRKEFRLRCSDCCLVHVLKFRIVTRNKKGYIEFKVDRDERGTAQARRQHLISLKQRARLVS